MAGYIGSKAVNLSTTGADINGNANIDGDLSFGDNNKAIFGAGSDLQIYHDGTHSYIKDAGTGNLRILGANIAISNAAGTENHIVCYDNGAVELSYDDVTKIATTSTGIDVTGGVTTNAYSYLNGLRISGADTGNTVYQPSGDLSISSASGSISLKPSGTNILHATNTGVGIGTSSPAYKLDVITTNSAFRIFSTNTAQLNIQAGDANESKIEFGDASDNDRGVISYDNPNNAFKFNTNASERMRIDSSGNVGIGRTPNSVLLDVQGSTNDTFTAARFRNRGQVVGSAVKAVWSLNRDGSDVDYEAGAISVHKTQQWTTAPSSIDSYMAFSTNNSESVGERMRIDSSGNLLVGKTSTDINVDGSRIGGFGAILTRSGNEPLRLNRRTSDGDIIKFDKDGSTVGSISNSGTNFIVEASSASRSGLNFGGSITPRYNQSDSDNQLDMGSASLRFDDIYATNGTIQTSDRNEKQDIADLSDAEQRVAVAAKGLLRKFRWKSAVEEKGDEARTHFGIIAQDLQAAFAAEGLDAGDYAMFISSTWTDEETGEERTRMGVRYSELLAFIIGAL